VLPPNILLGYLLAAMGTVLFAAKGVLIKLLYREGVDTETVLALRMAFAMPFYLGIGAVAIWTRGTPLPSTALIIKTALLGALGYWFASYVDFIGLNYISAQLERLILSTYPLFTVIFGALLFRQSVKPRALFAFVFSYAGLGLIFANPSGHAGSFALLGEGLVLIGAIAFALQQLLVKTIIGQVGPRLFTCIAMTAAGMVVLLQFLATHPARTVIVSPKIAVLGVLLAIGGTVLPSFLMNAALHRISAQSNATIASLGPVATILLAAVILGESMTMSDWIGAALVLFGVSWFTWIERR
jgi:drug/metabolite transporter (DMT)-like permease